MEIMGLGSNRQNANVFAHAGRGYVLENMTWERSAKECVFVFRDVLNSGTT